MTNKEITNLLNKENTPFYIFDIEELKKRINTLKNKSNKNIELCYAIKANPFLLPYLKDENILFEVCSSGELSICEKYKINASQIVFSGVYKSQNDIKHAYEIKVKTITLESKSHCEFLIQTVKEAGQKVHEQEVILRLSSGNQFGMSEGDIEDCISNLKKLSSVTIRGIHYFSGTQKKLNKIQDEIIFINDYCSNLIKKTDINFTDIEYGPGLSFNYFNSDNEALNFSEYEQFNAFIKDSKFHYVIELGRYIASSCGNYITKIVDVKENHSNNYCIIDGGINHINYYGQMMGMKLPPVEQLNVQKEECSKKYTICGSLCTTADVVLRELELKNPEKNDILIFKNIGAYSVTEGFYLFLSHALPGIYIYNNGDFTKVREQIDTYKLNS